MNKTSKSIFTNPWIVALLGLLCCALWGSATPFIKLGYEFSLPVRDTASTILFAGLRFTLAGVLTILIYSLARRRFLWPKKESWLSICKISSFQTVIQYIFFYIGLANTTGVKGTVGSASNTFFSILIACLIYRQEKLTVKKILACILGFAGIILVNLNGLDLTFNFTGDCFVLFAAVAYAFSSVLMKRYSDHEDPVILSGYQFVIGGLFLVVVGLLFGGVVQIPNLTALAVLLYLAMLSAIAYAVWGILLKHNPVSSVTIYCFAIPIFGVLLSALMLTENGNVPLQNLLLGLVLICSGIVTANYNKKH
ncbi:MAG: DMT family transporter [Ruminococcaceae bacterium]|nr:DMT family transporter [Oscillospiraceae bacterium]